MSGRRDGERDDEAREAESGAGEAHEGVPAEPSSHQEEEEEDTSGSREIPLGMPVERDTYRRAKEEAEISSDDAQRDPSGDDVDQDD
jgi:hypothetical protein